LTRFSNTDYELKSSSGAAATTTTPTAGAVSIIAGLPPFFIPGGATGKLGDKSDSWRMRIHGLATTTATIPTWKFGIAKTTTETAAFTGGFETATFTPGSALTNMLWWMDIDITLRTVSQTNTGVVVVSGLLRGPALIPSPFESTIPATNGANTWTDWDLTSTYWLWPYLTLGAATAGNTVTTQWCKLYGEN
jgi:hypothetical protein